MKLVRSTPDYRLGAILCSILVVLTVLVQALSFRFIEVPARNYLNNQLATKRKAISAAPTEV